MERTHTPEPWKVGFDDGSGAKADRREGAWICAGVDDVVVRGGESFGLNFGVQAQPDAERIVSCVNACAGMADPAATITALTEALKEVMVALANEHGGPETRTNWPKQFTALQLADRGKA